MIANLKGEDLPSPDPVRQAVARAEAAAAGGDLAEAIAAQEQAVALAREAGEEREALVALSVLLYNLGGYYGQAGRHEEAVQALEEVVALDEATGHPDLDSDRQVLAQARFLVTMSPEQQAQLEAAAAALPDDLPPQLRAQWEDMSPEEQAELGAQMQAFARQLEALSPKERAKFQATARAAATQSQIQLLADAARDGAIAALREEGERGTLAAQIEAVAVRAGEGEEPGSAWEELARYLRAVAALLRDEPPPPVSVTYAAHLAAIQQAQG